MTKKIVLSLATFALAIAVGASNYNLTLTKPAVVGGTEIKPGEYKVELNGNKVTLKSGKSVVDADVQVDNATTKFTQTTYCCLAEDGKYRIQELRIGGTSTKLTFKETGKDGAVAGH